MATEGRRAYARQLRLRHWPIIESVRESGALIRSDDNENSIRDLLENRAVMQYVNDEDWYRLNPFVEGIPNPNSEDTCEDAQ